MDFFDFFDGALDFFNGISSYIFALLNVLWTAIIYIYNLIVLVVTAIAEFLISLIKLLINFAKHVFEDIIHGDFKALLADYRALRDALKALFGPLLNIINAIHAWVNKYILVYIKLALTIISRIRVILGLFRLLGFTWAAKLDADLRKVQGYLTDALVDIVKGFNTVTGIINMMVDPSLVLRKDFFASTLFSSLAGVKRAVGYGSNRPLDPSESDKQTGDGKLIYGGAPFATRNSNGTITYSPEFQQASDDLDAAMKAYLAREVNA
jgi:hypothetical protein